MQVCIKKRRFIRLFFGGERERGWGGNRGEKRTNHCGPLSIRIEFSKPSRNQNEWHSRSSCLSSLGPCTSPFVVPLSFPQRGKRQEREKVKRLEGADVRHLPTVISFYPRHPLPTDWRRSNDDFVNDVRFPFHYASADSLCRNLLGVSFKHGR